MGFFTSEEFNNLEDLFVAQLQDVYDAEHRLTDALPKMSNAASSPDLKQAFDSHLQETRGQIDRLEKVFAIIGRDPARESCDAMKGLISEGEDFIEAKGDAAVKDQALIAAAQRVEHYEIAGYGVLRALAKKLGQTEAASLLDQTLQEEGAADEKLTKIAEDCTACVSA